MDLELAGASADARLFWAAASPWPDPTEVQRAIEAGADLGRVAAAAEVHRVGPLVLRSLDAAGLDLSTPELERIRAEAGLRRAQERIALGRALGLVVEPLTGAGLRPVLIKGPTLVERYPAPGLRGMDDLDVLLDPRDHPRAIAALEAAGWRRAAHRAATADVPFRHPDVPDLPVELHRDLERWVYRTTRLSLPSLLPHAVRRDLLGVPAYVLPPHLELLVLAVHAAKPWHLYSRLVWAADIAVVTAAEDVPWHVAIDHARRHRARTALAVGLRLAARLGGRAPAEAQALDGRAARAGLLDPLLDVELPLQPPERRRVLSVALADGLTGRVQLLAGMVAAAPAGGRARRLLTVARGSMRWSWRLLRSR